MILFVVYGRSRYDTSPLFWSNKDGWGHLSTATVFTQKEREALNLPVGKMVSWMELPRIPRPGRKKARR